jgi:hypothetical protein
MNFSRIVIPFGLISAISLACPASAEAGCPPVDAWITDRIASAMSPADCVNDLHARYLALAVSSQSDDGIVRGKTRCEATASGLAYARLRWRARDLE